MTGHFWTTATLAAAVLLQGAWATPGATATLELQRVFAPPVPGGSQGFGGALAISGNRAAIGTTATDEAFVYDLDTGELRATLTNPAPGPFANFGRDIAIEGDRVLVAAPNADRAFLYDATTGALQRTLPGPTGRLYGYSVAMEGDTALLGVRFNSVTVSGITLEGVGRADLVNLANGQTLRILDNPAPRRDDSFGNAVAMAGGRSLVGTPFAGALNSGAGYLFDTATGALLQTFTRPTEQERANLGFSVALTDTMALLGAPLDATGAGDTGAAYLFDVATGDLLHSFFNPAPQFGDRFGWSVALSDSHALIGARNDNTGGRDFGSAYLFDLATGDLLQTFNNPDPDHILFGQAVALAETASGTHALIGAGFASEGRVYHYTSRAPAVVIPLPAGLPLLVGALALLGLLRRRSGGRART